MARPLARARRGAAWQTGLGLAALGTVAALTGAFLVGPMLKVKSPKPATKVAEARGSSTGDETAAAPQAADDTPDTATGARKPESDADTGAPAKKPARDARKGRTSAGDGDEAAPFKDASDDDSGQGTESAPPQGRRASPRRSEEGDDHPGAGEDTATRDSSHENRRAKAAPKVSLRETTDQHRSDNPHAVAAAASKESSDEGSDEKPSSSTRLYRVRVGRYHSKDAADEVRARLTESGIPASVVKNGSSYTVQAGSYRVRENADHVADTLRQQDLHPDVSYR